jgi:hypothetical protein
MGLPPFPVTHDLTELAADLGMLTGALTTVDEVQPHLQHWEV